MIPPVTYQGGKGRLAAAIVEQMKVPKDAFFYDLCCGSGAVSLALIDAGHSPEKVVMVDASPWGLFWQKIGAGSFDVDRFRAHCYALPRDPKGIKVYIEALHRQPVATDGGDGVYTFLLLQAAAIGGKAVWSEGDKWARGAGYRDYWLPTATSSRRSPVNPMMPMPDTILERMTEIAKKCRGLVGICGDAAKAAMRIEKPAVAYIDPQYEDTTGYPYSIDAVATAKWTRVPTWVSEGKALSSIAAPEGDTLEDRLRRDDDLTMEDIAFALAAKRRKAKWEAEVAKQVEEAVDLVNTYVNGKKKSS